jgi:hypothetical protein
MTNVQWRKARKEILAIVEELRAMGVSAALGAELIRIENLLYEEDEIRAFPNAARLLSSRSRTTTWPTLRNMSKFSASLNLSRGIRRTLMLNSRLLSDALAALRARFSAPNLRR